MSAYLSVRAAVDPDKAIRAPRFFSYPKQILYLLASFIFLISIWHYIALGYRYFTRNRVYAAGSSNRTSGVSVRRLPIAIIDSLRAIAFRWTVPIGSSFTLNLAEVGLTLGYIGVLLSWSFVNTTATTGVKVDRQYYSNRVGTIVASQIPIMTALGMRNNLISYLTGVSFDKLNYLHRVSARAICILVWVHGAGRIKLGLTDDDALVHKWVQCGILAATTLTLMIFLTIRPVRQLNYELFLLIHFIFAFIFILSTYFHLAGRLLAYYGGWPSMIIWGIDRLLRLIQLVVYNFAYFNPFAPRTSAAVTSLNASVEVLSSDFLRLTIRRPGTFFKWRAGQSAFLSFPTVSRFPFESHPFTIASIDDGEEKVLTFMLRVRNGFTQRLLNIAEPGATYPVFINGPCSLPPILIGYQTVIMIAGGSGISFTLPLLLDVISRAKRGEKGCQKVIFIWAIRDIEHLQWHEEAISAALKDIPASLSVQITFCNTSVNTSSSDLNDEQWDDDNSNTNYQGSVEVKAPEKASSVSDSKILESPFVKVMQGRPSISALFKDEISSASGRMLVNVCGTHSLAATVRDALRSPRPMDILRGGPTVTLHVEAFGN